MPDTNKLNSKAKRKMDMEALYLELYMQGMRRDLIIEALCCKFYMNRVSVYRNINVKQLQRKADENKNFAS